MPSIVRFNLPSVIAMNASLKPSTDTIVLVVDGIVESYSR